MTTVVQQLYELPEQLYPHGERSQLVWNALRCGIGYPGYSGSPKALAERFIFETNLTDLSKVLRKHGLDGELAFNTARMVTNPMWLEYPDDRGKVGALVLEAENETNVIGAISKGYQEGADACPYIALRFQALPCSDDLLKLECDWVHKAYAGDEHEILRLMKHVASEIITMLFLLSVPRATELIQVNQPAKLQAARRKKGKLPLLEYKRVRMHIDTPRKKYVYEESETSQGQLEHHPRRLHQVMGHFRTYQKDRERPLVAWVPKHWRGDPEAGILLHERTVNR